MSTSYEYESFETSTNAASYKWINYLLSYFSKDLLVPFLALVWILNP